MKEIIVNVDNYNENSIKTIEGDNLSEVYKIYICKNKRRIDLTNKIAIMAYVDEYGSKRSNILNLNITDPKEAEIELPITNIISEHNGVYACQVAIYGENNSLEQTAPFSLIVENNIFSKISNTAINSSDFHILSEAIKTANEYSEKLKKGTENIELQYAKKLNEKANDNEVRKKNVLIDTKDITDNLRQQINGNAPIMQTIEDFSVTPIKSNFFDIEVDYKNILNINAQEIGALDTSNGTLSPISSFSRILFIPVVENTNYVFSINNLVSTNLSMVCYYRADKTFISGVTNVNKFTTPKDTAFISIVVYGTFNPKAQLEKGTDCTPFRPYKNITKNDGIKEEHLVKAMRKITPLEVQVNELFTFTSLDLVIEKGYYDTNKFFPNLAYDSVKIECKPGEKYKVTCFMLGIAKMPVARFYNSSFEEIAKTEIITNDETLKDYEIVVPSVENITYMTITCRNTSDVALEVEKYTSKLEKATKKPTCGLKYIAIGDSITAQSDRWRDQFINVTGAKEIMCTAVPGAHLADYNDTVLNGTNFEGHGNTVCNQIQKIINTPPKETPDFIIISAITNDTLGVEQLDKDINVFIDSDGFTYKDIETIDRTIIEGAMRWQVEKLYKLFPNVVIFFASPIQAFEGIRATWNILKKEDKIIRIARKMSVQVIKASSESGIYGRYEKRNENGKYLIDGLHPNKKGGVKLGNYYANQIINYYNYL